MSRIKTLSGRVVCEVHLLDNSMKTLLIEPTTTVENVVRTMAEKLGFSKPADDCLCFSLHECKDGVTIERSLPASAEVVQRMEEWEEDSAKFVFMAKLFTESLLASEDPKIIYMLYIQAVYNIITGTYPCSEEEAVQLAALQFQAKFGKHNPATHIPGFLTDSLLEYIPGPHLSTSSKEPSEWEKLIFQKHARAMTELPMQTYMNVLSKREYYGAILFAAKQEFTRSMPKRLFVGISRNGIVLLRIPESFTAGEMETLARYPLSEIYRWAYKPGINFYFEIKGDDGDEENPVFTFQTAEGSHMSELLTDYAMALLREMGLNPDGSQRAAPEADEPISSGGVSTGAGTGLYQVTEPAPEPAPAPAPAPAPEPEPEPVAEEAEGDDEALPEGWSKEYDEGSGAYYYFHADTGESSWEVPTA